MKTTDTLTSLMSLTDEPNEHLYINIANAIINYGETALPYLKDKLKETTDNLHVERLKNLIEVIERQLIVKRLKTWSEKREYDLLEPYFILSKYKFPKADWSNIGFQTIMIIEQVENELNYELTPLEQISRTFSLGILYCIIAERLGLPIFPVILPNHFILAYCKKTRHFPLLEDVLFYINPFNNGIVLTRKDIRNYLNELNIKSELKYYEPTKNPHIIKRLLCL